MKVTGVRSNDSGEHVRSREFTSSSAWMCERRMFNSYRMMAPVVVVRENGTDFSDCVCTDFTSGRRRQSCRRRGQKFLSNDSMWIGSFTRAVSRRRSKIEQYV